MVVVLVMVVVSCKNPQLTNHPTCAPFAPLGTLPLARMLPPLEQLWFPRVECRVTVEASISTGMNSSWLQRPTPLNAVPNSVVSCPKLSNRAPNLR